jgi:hypothetical protein
LNPSLHPGSFPIFSYSIIISSFSHRENLGSQRQHIYTCIQSCNTFKVVSELPCSYHHNWTKTDPITKSLLCLLPLSPLPSHPCSTSEQRDIIKCCIDSYLVFFFFFRFNYGIYLKYKWINLLRVFVVVSFRVFPPSSLFNFITWIGWTVTYFCEKKHAEGHTQRVYFPPMSLSYYL